MADERFGEGVDPNDTSAIPVDSTSVFQTYAPPAAPGSLTNAPRADSTDSSEAEVPDSYAAPPAAVLGGHPAYRQPVARGGASAYTGGVSGGRRSGGAGLLAGALMLGLIGGGTAGYLAARATVGDQEAAPSVVEAIPVGSTSATPITTIARHALPSVVFISVDSDRGEGVGSGFVVREDGYIVTNSHVVEAAGESGKVDVTFSDGEDMSAEIVGQDEEYDIAVIKVDRTGLPALEFGNSDAVQVGASVVAVGAPLGLDNTVTSGIVSALNRPVSAGGGTGSTSYINAIQTDAAINPGNSGGPLLDLNGQVVGVNSAIAQIPGDVTGGVGSIGLGFAIPAKQAQHTATQLIETGTSDHPVIGVMLDMRYSGDGAKVLEEGAEGVEPVLPGGPAEAAGIEPGDVLLSVDDVQIQNGSQLVIVLRSHAVGDDVKVLVRNADGDERTVTMTLQGSE